MAKKGQMIDELYISLGLDIASLQLDFDTAGKTVSNAISKINSETNKIKLRMDTDLSKLDGVGSELDKIRVKYEAINKQLDLQRQKESILAAVMKDAQKNSGIGSGAANKAETDLLRQQRLIAQTEAEIRKLTAVMSATTGNIRVTADIEQFKTAERNIQDSIARMNAKIQNIRVKYSDFKRVALSRSISLGSQTKTLYPGNYQVSINLSRLDTSDGVHGIGGIEEFRISKIARRTSNFTPPTKQYTLDGNTLVLLRAK